MVCRVFLCLFPRLDPSQVQKQEVDEAGPHAHNVGWGGQRLKPIWIGAIPINHLYYHLYRPIDLKVAWNKRALCKFAFWTLTKVCQRNTFSVFSFVVNL